MYKHLFLVIALSSLCCFLYGILSTIVNIERNSCRMTYMFDYPQFVQIHFDTNKFFPKYGLYAYSEGIVTENVRALEFNGAPVIFVPGNSGSYKQARSLASVALRKGLDNGWRNHLDYFTIDYNEEDSGLFGGYLKDQKAFLAECISAVLQLYNALPNGPKQVVLVGHSMGGKIAQSLLIEEDIAKKINTIIFIATPLDRPVINLDAYLDLFYQQINDYFSLHRNNPVEQSIVRNCCSSLCLNMNRRSFNESHILQNKLLISISGGNRDVLVQTRLTHSQLNDIHAMSSSIPNVWLSTDHLASVWCLQLVFVINRFLFSIISSKNGRYSHQQGLHFIEDKSIRVAKAAHFFMKPMIFKQRYINLVGDEKYPGDWIEDSRKVFAKEFNYGVNKTTFQMIRLNNVSGNKNLCVEAVNIGTEEWIFGCVVNNVTRNTRFCQKAFPLSHHIKKHPSLDERVILEVNLEDIRKSNPNWTHVILRILPTKAKIKLHIDIYDPTKRSFEIKAPKWFSYSIQTLTKDSLLGALYYKIEISDLDESYQALKINIKSRVCSTNRHHATAMVCIPWAIGYEKYQHFTESENQPLFISVFITKPTGYNTSVNLVTIDLYLDPNCRYSISYQNSFAGTLSLIVQQFAQWMPAHLTAVLILAFKYQISLTPSRSAFKCGKLNVAILQCSSFFILTASRIFAKILQSVHFLPDPENVHHSVLVSVIIHGSASALLLLATIGMKIIISFYGSLNHKIFFRLVKFSVPSISFFVSLIESFPLSAGAILISLALAFCGGIALILGTFVYLMFLAKLYETYLEEFVYDTDKTIAEKVFEKSVQNMNRTAADDEEKLPNVLMTVISKKKDKKKRKLKKATNIEHAYKLDDKSKEKRNDAEELEDLLQAAIEREKKLSDEKFEIKVQKRNEYNEIMEGLNSFNFHITLLMILIMLTILNVPGTISWAKNFRYSSNLSPDPSLIPSTIVLGCLSTMWRFSMPRNLYGYNFVSHVLYVCGAISIIYCQDSVYRLNGVIAAVFVIVTAHQLLAPKKMGNNEELYPSEVEI